MLVSALMGIFCLIRRWMQRETYKQKQLWSCTHSDVEHFGNHWNNFMELRKTGNRKENDRWSLTLHSITCEEEETRMCNESSWKVGAWEVKG
jgi:hypothetical protein